MQEQEVTKEELSSITDNPFEDPEFIRQKAELFSLNGITEEMQETWNRLHGSVGWTSFIVPGVNHAVVFVYRAIMRSEWKTLRTVIAGIEDADDAREKLCSHIVLHPAEASNTSFWKEKPALIPDTLETLIMSASGGEPQTPPMRL
jgi:hypothetical protein